MHSVGEPLSALGAPEGVDSAGGGVAIEPLNYDLRRFTMWKEQRAVVGNADCGFYYRVSRLPVSKRHNGGEGVMRDSVTRRLIHTPVHWTNKGWKLHGCADDLRPYLSDPRYFVAGFHPLPEGWQDHNEKTAAAMREEMARQSPQNDAARDALREIRDLFKEMRDAGLNPLSSAGQPDGEGRSGGSTSGGRGRRGRGRAAAGAEAASGAGGGGDAGGAAQGGSE